MNLQLENKLVYMYESIMTLNGFCDFDWCGRLTSTLMILTL